MSKIEKLRSRFYQKPKDFTWDEMRTLLDGYGYNQIEGKGSRVLFKNEALEHSIKLHKPHPGKIIKGYIMSYVSKELKTLFS
ncbi:MAG: hypothetical protein COC06_04795 [Bacteroidales bacterium]|nr:type II toxin-antitoxin system HicA family toxin [Labilibaculum sp.]PCH70439.1 MAG: hypothetical protein COC06_04795 [Bacteroidales bacterium]